MEADVRPDSGLACRERFAEKLSIWYFGLGGILR